MMMMLMVISSNVGFIGALPAGRGYLRGYMFLFFGKYMFLVGSDMFL
jgi:hypothetical protein